MKTAEIRELSAADLQERIDGAKASLQNLKLNHAVSPVENPTTIRKARREIARMMTVLQQKQNNQ